MIPSSALRYEYDWLSANEQRVREEKGNGGHFREYGEAHHASVFQCKEIR